MEKENQKLEVPFTEGDLFDLQDGEIFEWTFTTNKGEKIDIKLYNEDRKKGL